MPKFWKGWSSVERFVEPRGYKKLSKGKVSLDINSDTKKAILKPKLKKHKTVTKVDFSSFNIHTRADSMENII